MPIVLPPVPNRIDLKGAKVLVADDVADTGETRVCLAHTDKWIEAPVMLMRHT